MKARFFLLTSTISLTVLFFGYSQYLTAASSAISKLLSSSPEDFSHQKNPNPSATILQESIDVSISAATITPQIQSTRQKKTVLLKYIQWPGDGVDEIYSCIAGWGPNPKLILYDDGQLIQFQGSSGYIETYLSKKEMEFLLKSIEETGFFDLGIKPGPDEMSVIYNLPEGIKYGDGGWGENLIVKDIEIGIHPQLAKYLVTPIQDTLSIIKKFKASSDVVPFIPSKIHLTFLDSENKEVQKDFSGYIQNQNIFISDWPSQLPPLILGKNGIMGEAFLSENDIEIGLSLNIFSHFPDVKKYKQGEYVYLVFSCIPSVE